MPHRVSVDLSGVTPDTGIARPLPGIVPDLARDLFQRIVIPLSGSVAGTPLLTAAAHLAGRFQSEIILVRADHADPYSPGSAPAFDVTGDSMTASVNALMRAGASGVHTYRIQGTPANFIEAVAIQRKASLVMLASDADSGASAAWFGTLPQRLAMRLSVPLLITRPDKPISLKPLLCVVDGSDSSRHALKHAVALARSLQSRLTVLSVIGEPLPYSIVEGPIWQRGTAIMLSSGHSELLDHVLAHHEDQRVAEATAELTAFLGEFDTSGVEIDPAVSVGLPVVEALSEAKRRHAGLIVTGCGHRAGLIHIMTQNPAESLAELAQTPVLMFRNSAH